MSDFKINGTILAEYKGRDEIVHIPEDITIIGAYAFKNNHSVKEIYFPKTVQYIYEEAFRNCVNLEKVHLNDGLKDIDDFAFSFTNLSSLEVPDTVESFGYNVFEACQFTSIKLSKILERIPLQTFAYSKLERIEIPDSVLEIEASAFEHCENLKEVILPKKLSLFGLAQNYIGYVFSNCKSLERITLPEGVTEIPEATFSDCTSLKEIIIKAPHLEYIGEDCFFGCNSLKEIKLPACKTIFPSSFSTDFQDIKIYATKKTCEDNLEFYNNNLNKIVIYDSIDYFLDSNKSLSEINSIFLENSQSR